MKKKRWIELWPYDHVMPNSNLSGVSIPKPDRGMVNPPNKIDRMSIPDSGGMDSDITSEDWEEDMSKVVNSGKVCIRGNDGIDDEDDVEYIKRGKVCIRVGEFADWLRTHEPDTIDEYTHHIRTTASTIPLEQWADIHHPELREIWAIVRYRGDI